MKFTSSTVLAGIGFVLLANVMFAVNSSLAKWVMTSLPVWQTLLFRSASTIAILSPFVVSQGIGVFLRAPHPWLHLLRVACVAIEVVMYFWALSLLPLANVVTIYMAAPIFVTALSVPLLGEQVGWRRWTAVVIGFAGVVIALGPTSSIFTWPTFFALGGCILFSCLMILTRALRGSADIVLVTTQMAGIFVVTCAIAPFTWAPPPWLDVLLAASLGLGTILGSLCVNRSLKLAPANVVMPFHYTFIVWAIVAGYLFFGEKPQPTTLIGAAIIIAAGLYIFLREQQLGKKTEPVVDEP